MGVPAEKLHWEKSTVEERIARLEANVEHIQSDVSEIRQDVRRLDAKIDGVKDSVAALNERMHESFRKVDASLEKLRIGQALDKVWWLLIAGAILGVMARGFKWI